MTPFAQRSALRLAALAALVALAVSLALVHHHLELEDPNATSICAVSARVDCNTVLRSRYAVFLGVPIAAWGAGVYAVAFLVALAGLLREDEAPRSALVVALVGLGAVGFSAWLFYVSHWRLRVTCLLCHSLYVSNLAIALSGLWAVRRSTVPLRDVLADEWRRLAAHPRRAGAALALLVALGVALPYLEAARRVRYLAESQYGLIVRGAWERIPPERLPIGGQPSHGPADAPVTIVEFADFECPWCADARFLLEDIAASYPVRLVFVNFPAGPCNPAAAHFAHPFACLAAAAGEVAHREGVFWRYHEAAFAHPEHLRTPEGRRRLEAEVGLPAGTFESLRTLSADTDAWRAVLLDARIAHGAGVAATPTFFLNGMGFAGLPPAWVLEEMVAAEVARARRGEVSWRPVE